MTCCDLSAYFYSFQNSVCSKQQTVPSTLQAFCDWHVYHPIACVGLGPNNQSNCTSSRRPVVGIVRIFLQRPVFPAGKYRGGVGMVLQTGTYEGTPKECKSLKIKSATRRRIYLFKDFTYYPISHGSRWICEKASDDN